MIYKAGTLLDVSKTFGANKVAVVIEPPNFVDGFYKDPTWNCIIVLDYNYYNATPDEGGFHCYRDNDPYFLSWSIISIPCEDVGDMEDDL